MGGKTDKLEEVEVTASRTPDGRVIANGYHGYACQYCSCFHFDLIDDAGNAFATFVVEQGDLETLAHNLLAFAARVAMEKLYDGHKVN